MVDCGRYLRQCRLADWVADSISELNALGERMAALPVSAQRWATKSVVEDPIRCCSPILERETGNWVFHRLEHQVLCISQVEAVARNNGGIVRTRWRKARWIYV